VASELPITCSAGACERHIQLGLIAQGLLQYLAVSFRRRSFAWFDPASRLRCRRFAALGAHGRGYLRRRHVISAATPPSTTSVQITRIKLAIQAIPIPRAAHWTHQCPGDVATLMTTNRARMSGPTNRNFTARRVFIINTPIDTERARFVTEIGSGK